MISFDSVAPVKLKGVGDGFWLTINPGSSQDTIQSEIDTIFKNLKHLVAHSSVVIDVGDAKGHGDLIRNIRAYLKARYDVARITTPPEKRSAPTQRIRQRDLEKGWNHHRSDVLMLRGRIRSGQKIQSKRHIIIAGDVNPGAEICSGRDIVVLGRLSGKVHAGFPDNTNAVIFALEFKPSHVQIGTVAAAGINEEFVAKPEYACVENDGIMVKDYMKTNPFRKMPWPETV